MITDDPCATIVTVPLLEPTVATLVVPEEYVTAPSPVLVTVIVNAASP